MRMIFLQIVEMCEDLSTHEMKMLEGHLFSARFDREMEEKKMLEDFLIQRGKRDA